MHHSLALLNKSKKCCMHGLNCELCANLNKVIVINIFATANNYQEHTHIHSNHKNIRLAKELNLIFVSKQLEHIIFKGPRLQ